MKKDLFLAVDIGGTKIAAGIINSRGKVLFKYIEPTNQQANSLIFLNDLKRIIKHTIKVFRSLNRRGSWSLKEIKGIGLAAPGPLDIQKGKIIFAPNLPKSLKNFSIVQPLQKEFKLPVILENDANAAALGEWMFGAGQGTKNMIYLTISTGIGAGIIINGQLYHGQGNAGEIGHMIINPTGPICHCGNFGCLEAFASGTALANLAKKIMRKKIDSKEVFQLARRRNKLAKKVIKKSLTALGIGLVNVIHIFHPDKIVLGGGMMHDSDIILPFLKKFVYRNVMLGFKKNIKIEKAKLGDDVGLIGAAAIFIIRNLKKE